MLSTEQLLKPRKKVMLDFPDNDYEVGQIIEFNEKNTFFTEVEDWVTDLISTKGNKVMRSIKYFEPYPLIFRDMDWHEERALEDMPEYVKDAFGKVSELTKEMIEAGGIVMEDFIPSTLTEYQSFINGNSNK